MDEVKEEIEPAAPETATPTERQLMESFLEARATVDRMTEELKEATKTRDDIEATLIKILQDEGKNATARYEGLGHLTLINGAAHASIQKGWQGAVKDYLKAIGREDLIKETIAAASLSAFVRECLKQNTEIPPGVTFYSPQYLNFYPAK